MGRRALPRIDPNAEFSNYLFTLESLEQPFDPQNLFARRQPLELEIGSGKGHFLQTFSLKNTDRNYLGNEIAQKYARFAAYRLARQERPNARIISGDGLQLFHNLLTDCCAVGVHVYFPDPWWKVRHRRRRVMQNQFIADVERVLQPNGVLHFWTDVEEYFDGAIRLVTEASNLDGPIPVEETAAENDMDYRTHFERRMRINGHDIFRAQFKKT